MSTNINLSHSNFTLTPQAGTFGTINTSEATTRMRIKNTAGGLISDYTLSANMHPDNTLVGIEYCGPLNLTEMIDNVTFFTVERIPNYNQYGHPTSTSQQCIVKRWETNVSFSLLNLKQQWSKYTTGNFHYEIKGMSVEHYNRLFNFGQPNGQNYLDINNASHIKNGDILFLGPSTDTDNPGATEKVSVSFVDGNRVFLNSSTFYQYAFGDRITFFNNIYLISSKGYGGDTRYGTIFKHDVYSNERLEYTTSGEYARIKGARWSTNVGAIATINGSQLVFIRPYESYSKWKSMFLNNITSNNTNTFTVYDIVFDQFNIYKLMRNATSKDDAGNKTTEVWSTYNYQQDTLLPYTHNIAIYMKQQYTIGPDRTEIYLQTRDQFGVGLRDVNVNLYDDGSDLGMNFDPLNGQAITDKDGKANIGFIPGGLYTGPSRIRVRADKSSSFTGSEYCWNEILIDGKVSYNTSFGDAAMWQRKWIHSGLGSKQIFDPFMIMAGPHVGAGPIIPILPPIYFHCFSHFSAPGGDWVFPSEYYVYINNCWRWSQRTPAREDGPLDHILSVPANNGCVWDCISWDATESDIDPLTNKAPSRCKTGDFLQPRANFITQVLEVTQWNVPPDYYKQLAIDPETILPTNARPLRIPQPLDFWQYYRNMECGGSRCLLEDGQPIPYKMFQLDSENWMRFSQLNMSKHSHWVDGLHTEFLNTNVRLDQFIFVEDAVPSFWSEKNPRETDIWIRMRPFAFSLNGDTLKFFVREVWTVDDQHFDTGYYDVIERYG